MMGKNTGEILRMPTFPGSLQGKYSFMPETDEFQIRLWDGLSPFDPYSVQL